MKVINSETIIDDIEHSFKLIAGPGAGKTFWLVNHIKHVLHTSTRLFKSKRIACITYTNVAVETINNRLTSAANRVEVNTIHSFLYQHIIKPYAHLLSSEYGLNVSLMDGHDDTIVSNYSFLRDWKLATKQNHLNDDAAIVKAFRQIRWGFDASKKLEIQTRYPQKAGGKYAIRKTSYETYKRMAWGKGVVHHDDVLYFAFQILNSHPYILDVVRSKFPYMFLDEFQDSNPIQIEIIRKLGENGIVIGVVGDFAQSIYGFQGADPHQFLRFTLPGMISYQISDNRRSTNEIVALLNSVRTDLKQIALRNISGEMPQLLVGTPSAAFEHIKHKLSITTFHSLTRDNIMSNAMKIHATGTDYNDKLFDELFVCDKPSSSNAYRSKFISACIRATEYCKERRFDDAIKLIKSEIKQKYIKADVPREATAILLKLHSENSPSSDSSLYDYFKFIKAFVNTEISDMRSGAAKTFYESTTYQKMALCVNTPENAGLNKTIHKSKGAEYENVLVVLPEEDAIEFILSPNLNASNEEHRIYYVASSRARSRLFFSIPSLEASKKVKLSSILNIIEI